ncbi:MAG: M24 family metallopeptidase [Crocinitomicaceae bacterium]|nr:M24 family metallopeptidase [Crocinitomicaceae bacterium]
MNHLQHLIEAEKKAAQLFQEIENRGIVSAGKTEKELNKEVMELAFELYGIRKYWHKRIVRSGKNTLEPYHGNPPNLTIQADDILFFDFGPVFDEWEADFGRTYVVGNDERKLKLMRDVELAWYEGKDYFIENRETISGAEFYEYTKKLAERYGWEYGNEHCGHLIGNFPHEKIVGEERINYIHPENSLRMNSKDQHGNPREWIYEIHFVNTELEIGGFFEQLMFS